MFARAGLLILTILLGLPNPVQAQEMLLVSHPCDHRILLAQRPGWPSETQWLKSLNLSPAQKQRLNEIAQRYQPQIAQRQQTLWQLRAELRDLMVSNAANAQIRDKHRQLEALHQSLRQLRFESILAMREVLTPEQRRQFDAQMRDRHPRKRGRFDN